MAKDAKRPRKRIREPLQPIPDAFSDFLEHARSREPKDPLNAFKKESGLRLVGPFEFLQGTLDNLTDDELRLHWRFPNDLPEMQTCAVFDGGRFCVWRDEPTSSDGFIVAVRGNGSEHFAEIDCLGEHPGHMLAYLNASDSTFPPDITKAELKAATKKFLLERKKKQIGSPIHGRNGPGLAIKLKDELGYRPIPEATDHIKKVLTTIATTKNDAEREKQMLFVREILALIQMADDEMDFGMGLEFGHDCFLANASRLDKVTVLLLSKAYRLLKRDEYMEIVRVHFADGNRRRENLSSIA